MWQKEKTASIFIIFGLSFISGIVSCVTVKCLVTKFGKSKRFQRTIGILNCFAGGVFFSTCVLDILPEAREKMEEAKEHWGWSTEYPLSELLLGIGFFMILTLEHAAHKCLHGGLSNDNISRRRNNDAKAEEQSITQSSVSFSRNRPQINHKPDDHIKNDAIGIRDFEDSSCLDDVTYQTYGAVDASLDKTSVRPYSMSPDPQLAKDVEIIFENSDKIVIKQEQVIKQTETVSTTAAMQSLAETSEEPGRSNLRGLVLLMALSLHMVFDGLSLGLLQDTSTVWTLLLALSLHKVLVFFTIGLQTLELVKSLRKTIFYLFLFSLVSPIGIIIGESINSQGEESTQESVSAIMQGLAAGVFLYVTFFEIFQRELEAGTHDLVKVFVSILGFGLVGGTRLLEHDEE